MKYYLLSLLLLPIFVFGQTISPPVISHQSGFYTDEFYLKITHPDPNVTILYTLDGSEPKIENLAGKEWNYKKQYPTNPGDPVGDLLQDTIWTYEYADSILIRNRSNDPDRYADVSPSYFTNDWYNSMAKQDSANVFKGTVLRGVAYKNGIYSNIITKNIFITSEGINRYTLPITCLNIEPDIFFGYKNGLNVPGILFDQWRASNSTEAIDIANAPANFRASGSSSEIELHYAYLVDGVEVLNHGAGLRLQGTGSRYLPNRSYRLYAKSGYGASNFNYPYFADYPVNKFKRLILRNSGQDCMMTMFRDGFIQEASKKLNFETQAYQPSILFINGEYFGFYNLRERYDDKYFEDIYNINANDLDFLENDGIISEGNNNHYNSMMDYLENNLLEDDASYEYIKTLIDPINFTDYYITGIFISNIDWPQNNNEFWRKRVPYTQNAPYGHDGRWRWVLKDLDFTFGHRWDQANYTYDDLSFLSNLSADPTINKATLLFRRLLENESYKNDFINRFCDILNSTYKTNLLVNKIQEIKNRLSPEMNEFIERWSPTRQSLYWHHPIYSYSAWESNVHVMVDFAYHRPQSVRNHIQNRFNAGDEINVTLEVSDINVGHIKINTIDIEAGTDGVDLTTPYPWSGIYFKNVPITLKAIAKDGYVFTHWSGIISSTDSEITINLENTSNIKAHFSPCPLEKALLTPLPNLCLNDTPHILVEGTPVGGTYSIDGATVNSFDPSLGTQILIYTYEDQNGCIDSDTITVSINPLPLVNAGNNQFICTAEQVTLTGTGDATTYSWNNGVTDNISFIPDAIVNEYIVTGTDVNNCSNTDTVIVTVHPLPLVEAGEDQFVCTAEQITLTGSGNAISYSWNNGVIDNTPFIPSIVTGEYTVTGVDTNGCKNTDKITVTVNPLPNAFITQTSDMLTTSSGATSYQWIDCETNTPITGATSRSFMVPESGTYSVAIENQFGCKDTSFCLYVDFVGIDQLEVSNNIKIYPNPVSDKLFISFLLPVTEYSILTIVDLQGKTVHSENLADNMQQYEIEVAHLVSGVYLVSIGNKYIRFVKN